MAREGFREEERPGEWELGSWAEKRKGGGGTGRGMGNREERLEGKNKRKEDREDKSKVFEEKIVENTEKTRKK